MVEGILGRRIIVKASLVKKITSDGSPIRKSQIPNTQAFIFFRNSQYEIKKEYS